MLLPTRALALLCVMSSSIACKWLDTSIHSANRTANVDPQSDNAEGERGERDAGVAAAVAEVAPLVPDLALTGVMPGVRKGALLVVESSGRADASAGDKTFTVFEVNLGKGQGVNGAPRHKARVILPRAPQHVFETEVRVAVSNVFIGSKRENGNSITGAGDLVVVIRGQEVSKASALRCLERRDCGNLELINTDQATDGRAIPLALTAGLVATSVPANATPDPVPTLIATSITSSSTSTSTVVTTSSTSSTTVSTSTSTSSTSTVSSTTTVSTSTSSTPASTPTPNPTPKPGECKDATTKEEAIACCTKFYGQEWCEQKVDDGCKANPPKWAFCKPPAGSCSGMKSEEEAVTCCMQYYGEEYCREGIKNACAEDPPRYGFCQKLQDCLDALRDEDPSKDTPFECLSKISAGLSSEPPREQVEACGCTFLNIDKEIIPGRSLYECGGTPPFNVSPVPQLGRLGIKIESMPGCIFDTKGDTIINPVHNGDKCYECHHEMVKDDEKKDAAKNAMDLTPADAAKIFNSNVK